MPGPDQPENNAGPMPTSPPSRSSLLEGLTPAPSASGEGRAQDGAGKGGRKSVMLKVGGSLVLLVIAAVLVVRSVGGPSPGAESRSRVVVDSLTGEVFTNYPIVEGLAFPWRNPKTGDNTLYPGEPCYWTREGKAKLKPTYVFVGAYAGIPGRTICPDCGREVRQHNPMPPDVLMLEALKVEQGKK